MAGHRRQNPNTPPAPAPPPAVPANDVVPTVAASTIPILAIPAAPLTVPASTQVPVTTQAVLNVAVIAEVARSFDGSKETTNTRGGGRSDPAKPLTLTSIFLPSLLESTLAGSADPSLWKNGTWSYSTGSLTSTLCTHMTHLHHQLYKEDGAKHGWGTAKKQQQQQLLWETATRASSASFNNFNYGALKTKLVHFIVGNNQPRAIPGMPSYMMDLWSSQNLLPYLTITAHYIAWRNRETKQGLELKCELIAFHKLGGKHSGICIVQTVQHLLTRAGLTPSPQSHWTLDNTSNNGTFIESFLNSTFPNLEDGPRSLLIACFPHIINLCALDMCKALNSNDNTELDDNDNDFDNCDDTAIEDQTNKGSILWKHRAILIKAIREGNSFGFWSEMDKDGTPITVEIPPCVLLRDVCTQWDSVYYMLMCLLKQKQAIKNLINPPNGQLSELKKFALTDAKWD
ncbi:hypothetical protein DXG01_001144 [Tephrocybe rancida]|nr:hypothetical protein DXG01_001144 [Tephrocybe rancida]